MIQTNSDGGARGNPGPAAIGLIIRENNKILKEYSEFIGKATNNIAEYKALIKTLELALEFRNKEIICYLDSELVVKQVKGEYRVKDEKMISLFSEVKKVEEKFDKIDYKHVPRENKYQKIADGLLNEELNKRGFYKKGYYKK